MRVSKSRIVANLCLLGTLLIGLGCFMLGATLDDVLPHFMLDVVLTPDELADQAIRERTLSMLKQVKSGHAQYWFLTGTALLLLSSVGLYSASRDQACQAE